MKMLKWEQLEGDGSFFNSDLVLRTKIPGGWLVALHMSEGGGITFYPDPTHKWDGSSLSSEIDTVK